MKGVTDTAVMENYELFKQDKNSYILQFGTEALPLNKILISER